MSGEAEIIAAVVRIAAVLWPEVEAALRGGEPEETVIARLRSARPVLEETTAEDAERRARLDASAAAVSRVSVADVDTARRLAQSATLSGEERAAILRLAAHTLGVLGRPDDTRRVPT